LVRIGVQVLFILGSW